MLLNILAANAGFKLIAHFVFHTGVDEMRGRYLDFLHFRQFTDSWTPMLGSVDSFLEPSGSADLPGEAVRHADLSADFDPSAALDEEGGHERRRRVFAMLMFASWLAVCAVVGVAVAVAAPVVKRRARASG